MITHYLKVAFRNLVKYKTQTLISIIGLSVGFTCFALSVLWIRYEMTYDNFHEGADRIYLAGDKFDLQGDGFSYYSSSLLADYIMKNCPEVEKACHIIQKNIIPIEYEKNVYQTQQLRVDSNFVSIFNIIVLEGSNRMRLENNQIAITDKIAKQIFGTESPIGKQLIFPNTNNTKMTIVAVVKSWEGHSLYPFDILLPYEDQDPHWGSQRSHTLFRIYPNSDINALEKRLAKYEVQQDSYKQLMSTPIALLSTLRSTHPREDVNVKLNHIRLFAWIGALVIICGLCNYLTMLVTRIRMRKRELALRKVNGASNGSLLSLLLWELVLLLIVSSGLGLMIIELILPGFRSLSQIAEDTSFYYSETLMYILLLILITISLAAILIRYVSKQSLLDSIKHKSNLHLSGWFYKGSVSFQLFVSIGLVFCTMVMMKQLDYLLNSKELGLNRHNIGVIASGYGFEGVPFKEILEQMPDVIECLYGFYTPIPKMSFYSYEVREWEGQADKEQRIKLEKETINQDYANFFQVEVLEGNMLDEKDGKEAVLINEAAAKAFGWDHPIGKKIHLNEKCIVKGVIKNISYNAPIHPVAPAMFFLPDNTGRGGIIFKVKEGTWNVVSEKIKAEVNKVNPNAELMLSNMEEVYDTYMKSERTLCQLLSIVSFICIAIAVFGIFSLVTLSCQQRRKEIAIRKVNGANIGIILNLFFREYLLLLVFSSFFAFPLGYVMMKHWLENYIKQTPIEWWLYAVIFIGMGFVIFLSIIWRVWKAAQQNPAEVLKGE